MADIQRLQTISHGSLSAIVRQDLDAQIDSFRMVADLQRPQKGWIGAIRIALGMTERQLGERLGVSQESVHGLERSEAADRVRLGTLRRAAEALDCQLIYVLVPRIPLEKTVQTRAFAIARAEIDAVEHTMALEAQDVTMSDDVVADRARQLTSARRGTLWRDR